MKKIIFQDTTLRDGEQSSGIAFSFPEKLKIAKTISRLGVDVIELGFPAASSGEELIIKKLFNKLESSKVKLCVFARAMREDILKAYNCAKNKKLRRLQIVVPTSDLQIRYSTNFEKKELINKTGEIIRFAKDYFKDIQFTAQDSTRSDKNLLKRVLVTAVENGAKTLCLPDTTGYTTPDEYKNLVKFVVNIFKNNKNINISAHCHNDLGLATANSLAAINAGANQVECTLRGIGERAGNAAIEEILAILDLKHKGLLSNKINLSLLKQSNEILEKITKIKTPANKPILGENVFSHASGMHQKAILKNKKTFEILDAKKFGYKGANIVIGKLSGKAGLEKFLKQNKIEIKKKYLDSFLFYLKEKSLKEKIITKEIITKLYQDFLTNGLK